MLEREFVDLMRDIITIEPRTGTDRYNNATYGPAVTYLARAQAQAQEVRDEMGNVQISSAQVWAIEVNLSVKGVIGAVQRGNKWYLPMAFSRTPKPPDRLTLPDGTQPLILRSNMENDETGPHHLKVFT